MQIVLNDYKLKTLGEIGIILEPTSRNSLVISTLKNKHSPLVVSDPLDDDLLLGASASPTAGDIPSTSYDTSPSLTKTNTYKQIKNHIARTDVRPMIETVNYVGLVNQAMTCYLNSLLQALYMTPEFRNALYNWEFDGLQLESKSIPFQLQKLFLNLQVNCE